MSSSNNRLQRSARVMKILGWGLIADLTGGLFLYPPGFLWGSHPASFPNIDPPHPESPLQALHPYLFMILSIYVAYGILLIRGAKDPKANVALFDFGIFSLACCMGRSCSYRPSSTRTNMRIFRRMSRLRSERL